MLSLYKVIQTYVYHKQNKIHPTSTHCNLKEAMQRKCLTKYLKNTTHRITTGFKPCSDL